MTIVEARVRVEQIVVVPRNGLANRLQAWASAAILAAEWDVPLKVVWETEPAMPATAADLFASRVVERFFTDPDLVTSLAGAPHAELPRYLSRSGQALVLAGHDRGEQAFMPQVVDAVGASNAPSTLIFIAGGKFHLPVAPNFVRQRGTFYREIAWSPAVDVQYGAGVESRGRYAGLHVRQTDRSLQAPPARMIRHGLAQLEAMVPERDLFIAADTDEALEHWVTESRRLGFQPWCLPDMDRSRDRVGAIVTAAADWRALAGATGLVYSAVSTFSEEASVASGHPDRGIPLEASVAVQRMRAAGTQARSVFSYPARRIRATRSG